MTWEGQEWERHGGMERVSQSSLSFNSSFALESYCDKHIPLIDISGPFKKQQIYYSCCFKESTGRRKPVSVGSISESISSLVTCRN